MKLTAKNKIRILVDNKAEYPLISEHGFAAIIETETKRILFDTGQEQALFNNAEHLKVSLTDIDILVLSHGHYDHSGNIARIIKNNPDILFYAHPDCMQDRYSYHEGKPLKYVGISERDKEAIQSLPENQIHWCSERTEITKDIYITGFVPREHKLEDTGGDFYLNREMSFPDIIKDDLSLWFEGDRGLTVLCGCCHSGVQNTINHICSFYVNPHIETLAGGFHLVHSLDERIESTLDFLEKIKINHTIGGHCTGEGVLKKFSSRLRHSFSESRAGFLINVHMHS